MSKFIGVKMVEAVPMTAIEADKKGYRVNKEKNTVGGDIYPSPEGYEVTYPDGYKSWCPKDVFEKNNYLVEEETRITRNDVKKFITSVDVTKIGDKTTVINAHTLTGFDMVSHSSCVAPENYNETLGKNYALENVFKDLWGHLGFVLQWAKYGLNKSNEPESYISRMLAEQDSLGDKITRLRLFISTNPVFNTLSETKKSLMIKQLTAMDEYFNILGERIKEESISK